MAGGINIPGVSDKYKTNDLVESLMAVERKPLDREKENLETYKTQQSAWRDVNRRMSTLRDSVKSLYSFENPFNNKLASSSDENSITASAGREAEFGSFKIDVDEVAKADRFLSGTIDKNTKVPAGTYGFQVGDKSVSFKWKGGKLSDFVNALNKRGSSIVKASVIGVSSGKQSLLIESLKTGAENRLILKDSALEFAKNVDMIRDVKSETTSFSKDIKNYKTPTTKDEKFQANLPVISKTNVTSDGKTITIPPRSGIEIPLPDEVKNNPSQKIEFTLKENKTADITEKINHNPRGPLLPLPGEINFKGITVQNNQSDPALPPSKNENISLNPVEDTRILFIKNNDGSETELDLSRFTKNADGQYNINISSKEFPDAQSIIIRNSNTGKELTMSIPYSFDSNKNLGYEAVNPISTAGDAIVHYEGITITRPVNDIDDIVEHVTLHLHEPTEKTATIKIDPDKEGAKNALITFVGKYNQTIAEMTILSTNKSEVVSELDYLSKEEQDAELKKLGMFSADFSLTNGKSTLQQIATGSYRFDENQEISMLSQIGISTNASSGFGGGYNASQMRGYLEVDEKKLDEYLESHLDEIKNLFGYDSDGDLIIDNGLGYRMEKVLAGWVQSGGILSTKTSALDKNIKSSNEKIKKLETQLAAKESELKRKYAAMEGTLNSLESQQNSISNFTDSFNQNK